METLKDLLNSDSTATHNIRRWESDVEFRKNRPVEKYLDSLTTYVSNHIALQYYLLDNYITIEGDGKMSIAEALLKLRLLKLIYKVAKKEDLLDKINTLEPIIREYETAIETATSSIKLLKPT